MKAILRMERSDRRPKAILENANRRPQELSCPVILMLVHISPRILINNNNNNNNSAAAAASRKSAKYADLSASYIFQPIDKLLGSRNCDNSICSVFVNNTSSEINFI